MKTANGWVYLTIIIIATLVLIGFKLYLDSPTSARDLLLSPNFYYELPSGGYLYIEDKYIRYNPDEFDGQLDYRITLNYIEVKK